MDTTRIEQIVRGIVNRVATGASQGEVAPTRVPVPVPAPVPTPVPQPVPSAKRSTDTFLLEKRVVTLRDVERLPLSVRRLGIPVNALVTPAVLDELSERKITLVRVTEFSQTKKRGNGLDVYTVRTGYHAETFLPVWTRAGYVPRLLEGETDFASLRKMLDLETLSIVLTSDVDEALCLLNRDDGVFAIQAGSLAKIAGQVRKLSANVVVLDPAQVGAYLTGRLVTAAAEAFYG
ncbi:MAG: hypothetical protein Q4D98_14300 [Planctomycetia bacterium]|nr:hypothetical protein [Planctomycetia bacterium]